MDVEEEITDIWYRIIRLDMCDYCRRTLLENMSLPRFAIRAGYDYGRLLDMQLPRLSYLERLIIMSYISFGQIAKVISHSSGSVRVGDPTSNVTATANMLGLTGHIITFPLEAGTVLDDDEYGNTLSRLSVPPGRFSIG